jgi:hypothetical protein
MKIIRVTYTVKAAFAQQNLENVSKFIADLKLINDPAIRYTAYVGADGKTFNHFAVYQNEEAQKTLFALESFQSFQKQRDESGLEVAPNIEELKLASASYNIF